MALRRLNASYNVFLSPRDGDGWLSLPQRDAIVDDKNGTFVIHDLLPGRYLLGAFWLDEGKRYQAYQSIAFGNAEVEVLGLTVTPGMHLNGRVAGDAQPASDTDLLRVYLRGA